MLLNFELNVISALFLTAGIHPTKTYKQAKNFFIQGSTQFSSEKSFKEKGKTFISMSSLSTWLDMQMLNLCHGIGVFTALSNI